MRDPKEPVKGFEVGQRLLTAGNAAHYLGICPRTLWTLGNRGEIRSVRFGAGRRQSVRYDLADLDAWIESRKKGGGTR